jgi:tetratricopeptide (TPR) repeat protein
VQRTALDRGWYERTWQIAEALWPLCASHRRFREWIDSHEMAILAGKQIGDQEVLARMHSQLARAYAELGDIARAEREMALAMTAARAANNPALRASVIEFAGVCELRAGQLDQSLNSFRLARANFEACGLRRGVALQDYHMGWCLVLKGEDEFALNPLAQAQTYMEQIGDEINVGRCLVRRGQALWHLRRDTEASDALDAAVGALDDSGVGFERAEAHEILAEIAEERTDHGAARAHRQSAYRLYHELGHPRADALIAWLDSGATA